MFVARGLAVSFSFFFIIYCLLSLVVALAWRRALTASHGHPTGRIADLLFVLRMFPLASAAFVTVAFALPSFLLLEPRKINEPLSPISVVLGICGAGLTLFSISNAGSALWRAWRTIEKWMHGSRLLNASVPIPVIRISPPVPAIAAAGIIWPKVLLSGTAESVLTPRELQAALNHEMAHVRRRDNLKKLLLRCVPFAGTTELEAAWLQNTEMAADDAAVTNVGEALDLAAALIKLSRLGPLQPPAELAAALVHSPASAVNARVERLIGWSAESSRTAPALPRWLGVSSALAAASVIVLTYTHLLASMHEATEWLFR